MSTFVLISGDGLHRWDWKTKLKNMDTEYDRAYDSLHRCHSIM